MPGFQDTLVGRTVQEVNILGSALQQVQQVCLQHGDVEEVFDLAEAQMILSLPNVFRVLGDGVGMPEGSDHAWRMPKCPNMREVGLDLATVNVHGFNALLCTYENLETLRIECADPEEDMYVPSECDYAAMGHILRQYGTKLVNLKILGLEDEDDPEFRTGMGSLAELTSLRTLTLPYQALYGDASEYNQRHATWLQQVLPSSLESLEILLVDPDVPEILNEQVKALLSDRRFTELITVHV